MSHVLGIGHSEIGDALMFFDATEKAVENLHQDDADALCYLYPRNEPSDLPLGCGLVETRPRFPPWSGLLLFLPLLVVALLRLRIPIPSETRFLDP